MTTNPTDEARMAKECAKMLYCENGTFHTSIGHVEQIILALIQRVRLAAQIEQLQGCLALANIERKMVDYREKLSSDVRLMKDQLNAAKEVNHGNTN